MQEFQTELDRLNRHYRGKIVTILTVPMSVGSIPPNPEHVAQFCTGIWVEAMESGVWLQMFGRGEPTRDFFYHNHIIKIEEAVGVEEDVPQDIDKILRDEFAKQDEERVNRSRDMREEMASRAELAGEEPPPDVIDPFDTEGINAAIDHAREMLELEKGIFLDNGRESKHFNKKLDNTETEQHVDENDDGAEND